MLTAIIEIESNADVPTPVILPELIRKFAVKHAHLLFPNTPIQVGVAEDRLHFYVEGVWNNWEYGDVPQTERLLWEQQHKRLMATTDRAKWLMSNLAKSAMEIVQVNYSRWESNPDRSWVGWRELRMDALSDVLSKCRPSEAQGE